MQPAPLPATSADAQSLLRRVGERLVAADAAMRDGELEAMHAALSAALGLLVQLAHQGHAARRVPRAAPPWDGEEALALLWQLLAQFKAAGCRVFPFAGTLLGLERDGRLLPGDKDADLGVWLEDFSLAVALMQQAGWRKADNVPPFDNMASLVEPASGLSVDLFGIGRDAVARRLEGGVWMYGRPASHQRVTHYPWVDLAERASPAGPVWWPQPAEGMLQALYGDWRRPQPDWDSLVSCLAVQDLNLHWHCWALKSLCDRWLSGDLAHALSLLDQIEGRCGAGEPWRTYRQALNHAPAPS